MKKQVLLITLGAVLGLSTVPASAAFFMEGLKEFTQAPKCPDPYALDKIGCEVPDTAYPAPEPKPPAAPVAPEVRTKTKAGQK